MSSQPANGSTASPKAQLKRFDEAAQSPRDRRRTLILTASRVTHYRALGAVPQALTANSQVGDSRLTEALGNLLSTDTSPSQEEGAMFRPEKATTDYEPASDGERAAGVATRSSLSRLGRIYRGERDTGQPVVLVTGEDGIEISLASQLGGLDWGWPSMNGTRQLARALLTDATGREPPPAVRDAFATEELAHFPWGSFCITGRELLEWIESRDYELVQWPAADSTPVVGALGGAPSGPRDRRAFVPIFLRLARTRAPQTPLGASR
jgi:hypothetical protein